MPKYTLFLVFIPVLVILQSCQKDKLEVVPKTYNLYQPVFVDMDDYRQNAGTLETARPIRNPGGVLTYGDYLFISEVNAGIHIIQNAEPSNPRIIGFIALSGVDELSIRDNFLYAADYVDLAIFDLSNPEIPELVQRSQNLFTDFIDQTDKGILVDYELAEQQLTVAVNDPNYQKDIFWVESEQAYAVEQSLKPIDGSIASRDGKEALNIKPNPVSSGLARVQSKFSISDNYLYFIKDEILQIRTFSSGGVPQANAQMDEFGQIQSVLAYDNYLVLSGDRGLFVLDNRVRSAPRLIENFRSYTTCSPTFFMGNFGYIGVRTGACGRYTSNRGIFVHNFSEPEPVLWQILAADNPYDIEIVGQQVLIADGANGILIHRTESSTAEGVIMQADQFIEQDAFQLTAIPGSSIVVVVGESGIHQYDFSQPETPQQLSVIPL